MLARALPRDVRFDLVVPMPMHWLRRWRRGFNQAELLACEIGRRWACPCGGCRKSKGTSPQAGLTAARRRDNVASAFRVPNARAVEGRRILLVDDVLTTGATAGACALALKRAGAASVTILTVARADRRTWTAPAPVIATSFTFQPTGRLADGKSDRLQKPVLVLNASYEPINICAARRAVVLMLKGVASPEEDRCSRLHSARKSCACRA